MHVCVCARTCTRLRTRSRRSRTALRASLCAVKRATLTACWPFSTPARFKLVLRCRLTNFRRGGRHCNHPKKFPNLDCSQA